MRTAAAAGRARWPRALLLLGLCGGCPSDSATTPAVDDSSSTPASASDSDDFRRKAHADALGRLRTAALPALRRLDPVAAAAVEGAPLRPPRFGATARSELRPELERATTEAEGIDPRLLAPTDRVVLRTLQTGLSRGFLRLGRPPWRDDPGAVLYALAPYLQELSVRLAAGECEHDGCGIEQLAPALRAGFGGIGSASPATVSAAREDLAALSVQLEGWAHGRAAQHPVVRARPDLRATLDELDAELERAAAALATATELPWSTVAPRADAAEWKRRPARWTAARLTQWLTDEEAYGHPPRALLDGALAAAARMSAMVERESAQPDDSAAIARPFDAAACAEAFAPFEAWVKAQAGHLRAELDCAALLRELPESTPDDPALVLRMVDRGIIRPSREALVAATGTDVALVRGQAAPAAQRTTLRVAITAATRYRGAELRAVEHARHDACLAAVAVWIHGQLGTDDELRALLAAPGCGDADELVAAAEARPRTALLGLGLVLLGLGPADAAALDRYWWAPLGVVRDLAMPPADPVEGVAPVAIESLDSPPGD